MMFPYRIRVLFDRIERFLSYRIAEIDILYGFRPFDRIRAWFDRYSESTLLCHDCCVLDMQTPNDAIWKPLFDRICFTLGFNQKAANILWEDIGTINNWEHFHPTDNEDRMSSSECREHFLGDVHYCSDRWSFDRLLRVQWMYRHWDNRLGDEEVLHETTD